MSLDTNLEEYLAEIRKEVCSRCVERPEAGPPCSPLGKVCGVEQHLPELVSAVRDVHSDWMGPYLDGTRQNVCRDCSYQHHDCCPCPMDSLALLVVSAVEAVDERHALRQHESDLIENIPPAGDDATESVSRAYEAAVGRWTGCDWPTGFAGVHLNGVSASEAETLAGEHRIGKGRRLGSGSSLAARRRTAGPTGRARSLPGGRRGQRRRVEVGDQSCTQSVGPGIPYGSSTTARLDNVGAISPSSPGGGKRAWSAPVLGR